MRQVLQSEASALTREARYALRRRLVARLQAATRGVSRGDRSRALRDFAEGWRDAAARGVLVDLARLVSGEDVPFGVLAPALHRLASAAPAMPRPQPLVEALAPAEAETSGSLHPVTAGARTSGADPAPKWGIGRQGDLFPSGLVAQPL